MNLTERLKCLEDDVQRLVQRYGKDAVRHKKTALALRILSVLIAAAITILLGLKAPEADVKSLLSDIALVLGAIITVLGAYEAFFDPKALWIRETVTFARLKDLQRDLRYWSRGIPPEGLDEQRLEDFKRRLDRVLEDSLKYWMKVRGAPDLESQNVMPRQG
jgi:hypothetical protein